MYGVIIPFLIWPWCVNGVMNQSNIYNRARPDILQLPLSFRWVIRWGSVEEVVRVDIKLLAENGWNDSGATD